MYKDVELEAFGEFKGEWYMFSILKDLTISRDKYVTIAMQCRV